MDKEKSLQGFSGNQLLLKNINGWSLAQQEMFFKLVELLHSSGIDMWCTKKKNFIRCGIRFPNRNHGRGYLRFCGIACNIDGPTFSMHIDGTKLPQKQRVEIDSTVLRNVEASFSLWNMKVIENGIERPLNSVGLWPRDYEDEDTIGNDSDLEGVNEEPSILFTEAPLNQILFGPPGTGKTYSTINAALEILDPEFLEDHSGERDKLKYRFDELVKNQHIRFVTFHQSFSYEDFVEGLSAETENGQIRYDVKSGVFMQLCEAAVAKVVKQESVNLDVSKRRVWKMSLGNTLGDDAYIFDECIADNKILLGYPCSTTAMI